MAFYRKSGERNVVKVAKASGTAIAVGDLVIKNSTNNNVTTAATSNAILGIALDAGASASTAAIRVDVLRPGDMIEGTVSSGTPASGDFKSCTLSSASGVNVGATTNNDFTYMYNGTTDTVWLFPQKLQVATAS